MAIGCFLCLNSWKGIRHMGTIMLFQNFPWPRCDYGHLSIALKYNSTYAKTRYSWFFGGTMHLQSLQSWSGIIELDQTKCMIYWMLMWFVFKLGFRLVWGHYKSTIAFHDSLISMVNLWYDVAICLSSYVTMWKQVVGLSFALCFLWLAKDIEHGLTE